MKLIAFALIVVSLNALLNVSRAGFTRRYYRKFKERAGNINEYTAQVERLFDKAGTNRILSATRWQGEKLSQCLNMDFARDLLHTTFQKTIGVYKFRAINSFNPLYWFEAPTRFLKNHHIELPSAASLVLQAVFWAVAIIAGHCLELLFDARIVHLLPQAFQSILK